ncbi:tripartite tricarboxylate transporter TctB family protein [Roseicitreum antarcticum]|uniref:Tripartite tricarboxylate transporter TctB family protein n=1 Tax=Roseicitreum antarcticum TaxID=564137 RepID=A0A1H3AKD7_9RHOB|nr:tripartite tricarboxylate transporter TctB family protein [Roseicitreum antarcticum]SDX29848.1 Tripartite tricarboxylate transporter TctB family protein [Roseicitreum antarcticum]
MKQTSSGSVLMRLNFNSGVALVCIVLGITIWLLIPYQVAEPPRFFGRSSAGMSPSMFPQVISIGLVLVGGCYLFASLGMTEVSGFRGLPLTAYINLGVILVAMIAYVALLRPVGYVASSMVVATSISFYYGSRNPVGIGITGILAPLCIYYLFTRYLSVSLPPFPWG